MPGGGKDDDVFSMFNMCIASFIYHRQWLDETLHPNSEVRTTIFWSETVPDNEHYAFLLSITWLLSIFGTGLSTHQ
jgi:hypothetical protein